MSALAISILLRLAPDFTVRFWKAPVFLRSFFSSPGNECSGSCAFAKRRTKEYKASFSLLQLEASFSFHTKLYVILSRENTICSVGFCIPEIIESQSVLEIFQQREVASKPCRERQMSPPLLGWENSWHKGDSTSRRMVLLLIVLLYVASLAKFLPLTDTVSSLGGSVSPIILIQKVLDTVLWFWVSLEFVGFYIVFLEREKIGVNFGYDFLTYVKRC